MRSVYMKQDKLTGTYYDDAMAVPLMLENKNVEDMDNVIKLTLYNS